MLLEMQMSQPTAEAIPLEGYNSRTRLHLLLRKAVVLVAERVQV